METQEPRRLTKKSRHDYNDDNDDELTTLSLSFPARAGTSPQLILPDHPNIPSPLELFHQFPPGPASSSSAPRPRRNPAQTPKRKGKTHTIPAPYQWATIHRARVHTLDHILNTLHIDTITGDVQCRRCEKQFQIGFNLRDKFLEVGSFIAKNKGSMHDRAPLVWRNPVLPPCRFCNQENSAKPVLEGVKKRQINWLFLLLGQLLGCCTLRQLKYFCKHTNNHRTGAKDRVLYLAYLELCKQLDPTGPFDR